METRRRRGLGGCINGSRRPGGAASPSPRLLPGARLPVGLGALRLLCAAAVSVGMLLAGGCPGAPLPTEHVAAPAFEPPPGSYARAQVISIATTTPGATILYTVDGSDPSSGLGLQYSGPLSLPTAVTVRAVAQRGDMLDSEVVTATYTTARPDELDVAVTWPEGAVGYPIVTGTLGPEDAVFQFGIAGPTLATWTAPAPPAGAMELTVEVWDGYVRRARVVREIVLVSGQPAVVRCDLAPSDIYMDDRDYVGDTTYDAEGIIMKWYVDGYYHNPVLIANKALYVWNRDILGYYTELIDLDGFGVFVDPFSVSLGGDEAQRRDFLKSADWYVTNAHQIANGALVWRYYFDYFAYLEEKPWVSGMAQGRAMQMLLRAYLLTGDGRYLDTAEGALGAYEVGPEEGGVRQTDGEGYVYYEEYPGRPTSHVLNGFIFALWGLYEHWVVTGSERSRDLLDDGLATLERRVGDYDGGSNSKYDLIQIGQVFRFVLEDIGGVKVTEWTASHSNQPTTNGPETLTDHVRTTYWASNQLPAVVELGLAGVADIVAVDLCPFSEACAPSVYEIDLLAGEEVILSRTLTTVEDPGPELVLPEPVRADAVRVRMDATRGADSVALREITLTVATGGPAIDSLGFAYGGAHEEATVLDVGGDDIQGSTGNDSRVDVAAGRMWSRQEALDNHSVRRLDPRLGQVATANMRVPPNANYPGQYSLFVDLKDTVAATFEVQIYDGASYVSVGHLDLVGDQQWKRVNLQFGHDVIRGRDASEGYNALHAKQLAIMHAITGVEVFQHYSEVFAGYAN